MRDREEGNEYCRNVDVIPISERSEARAGIKIMILINLGVI